MVHKFSSRVLYVKMFGTMGKFTKLGLQELVVTDHTMIGKIGKHDKMRLTGQVKVSPTLSRRQVKKSHKYILARLPEKMTSVSFNVRVNGYYLQFL